MVIDCHYHYEEEITPVEQLLRDMDSSGMHKAALMAPMNAMIPLPGKVNAELLCFCLTHSLLRSIPKKLLMNFTREGNVKLPGGTYDVFRIPTMNRFSGLSKSTGTVLSDGCSLTRKATTTRWKPVAGGFIGIAA